MLTKQLFRLSEEEQKRLEAVKPFQFPKYLQRKMNPQKFLQRLEQERNQGKLSEREEGQLLLEVGKLRIQLNELDSAAEVLKESIGLKNNPPEARFYLGVIAYRLKNLYEARLHFSQFVRSTTSSDFELEDENLHQMASHYLEILDRKEFKRSSFKLIQ